MKKRLLAIFCILAILLGMIVVPALAETVETESTGYKVGYAKVDINPWVNLTLADGKTIGLKDEYSDHITTTTINDPTDPSKTISQKIVAIPLGGYGNSLERLATDIMDDNGDGYVGYGDGVYSTCTTVTDANNTTVLYVTLDCIRASDGMTKDIRDGVVAAIGNKNISADRIMLSASHSHSAPDFGYLSDNEYAPEGSAWGAYYDYVIKRIVEAAKEAYDNRSDAEMSKGSIEAPVGMKAQGYGDGVSLNFVRHTVGTYTLKQEKNHWLFGKTWSTVATADLVRTNHSGQAFEKTVHGAKYKSSYVLNKEVSQADETLHVLRFQFTDETRNPVVLINWRTHAALSSNSSDPRISSDYVNSLRYNLENAGYCVGFWQGASGNVEGGKFPGLETAAWENFVVTVGEGQNQHTLDRAAKYGYFLAKVALACLDSSESYMKSCEEGAIRTRQVLYYAKRYEESPEMITAKNVWQSDVNAGYKITYPYFYETSDATYIINSENHAQQIIARERRKDDIKMELNVMMLGEDVALVTLPVEPFDRYSEDATVQNTTDNDWEDLDALLGYTPFVLGYSNGHEGYLPNKLAYEYNDLPTSSKYYGFYGVGSYESDTAKMVKGSGEAVIAELGTMFEVLTNGGKTEVCEDCGTKEEWKPLTKDQLGLDLNDGHYYLAENITAETVVKANNIGSETLNEKVCLDLNGKTLDHKGQVFKVYSGSTLNIMDTSTGGKIIARSGGDLSGGVADVSAGGTMNLYGGTLQFIKDDTFAGNHTARGGVIYNSGTLNVYDGTIKGGEIVVSDWKDPDTGKPLTPNGVGGAVALSGKNVALNMYGGRIEAGPSVDGVMGSCVYVSKDANEGNGYNDAIKLTNDAYIEEIYVDGHYMSPRNILITGKFTGNVTWNLNESNITLDDKVYVARVSEDADISEATLRCVNDPIYSFEIGTGTGGMDKGRLYIVKQIYDASVEGQKYTRLNDAIAECSGGEIKLLRDVQGDVTVNQDIDILDLNGFDITGNVYVNEGCTLTCIDFRTDDYTVEDDFGYGKIGSITGTGKVVAYDNYVMLGDDTNGDGVADQNWSFHKVDLDLKTVTLRAKPDDATCSPSVYYTSNFAGDEVVKENVGIFGVALSLKEEPDADNMGLTNLFSKFEAADFKAGGNDNDTTSTLLYGVMREEDGKLTNSANANRLVYGRAYIQLSDGSYIFGNSYTVTLKKLTEAINNKWSEREEIEKEKIFQMYKAYQKIMSSWNVDTIKTEFETRENEVLKILVVGNSHGQDATTMLNEIFKAEKPGQKVVIGALLKSGCIMREHADFMANGKANYDYLKNGNYDGANADGSWQRVSGVTADVALSDECWDYVVMQELNHYSGMASMFNKQDFMTIINYVESKVTAKPKYLWHMVWANPDDADLMATGAGNWTIRHDQWFPGEDGKYDRHVLYGEITKYAKQFIVNNVNGSTSFLNKNYYRDVMPSATAIQYAQDVLGYEQNQVYRDYTHLSDYGRLMTSYLWYAKLMGLEQLTEEDVTITEIPAVLHTAKSVYPAKDGAGKYTVTEKMREDIVKAVNYTLQSPYAMP